MTGKNLNQFVILCIFVFAAAAVFHIVTPNRASAAGDRLLKRQKAATATKIKTDKTVYKKGETARLGGDGFRQFEEVTINIEQFDESLGQNVLRAGWVVFTDAKGAFVSDWVVGFEGKFTVKAVGSATKQEIEPVSASSVTPIVVAGNPSCAELNSSNDPAFAHISSNFGFKIDPPASGTFNYTNGPGRVLTGGAPADPGNSLTISNRTATTFDWSSTRPISAVIVKGGPNANVYPYDPSAFADTALNTVGNGFEISHIEVCFGPAPASITIIKDAQPNSPQSFGFTAAGQVNQNFALIDNGVVGPDRIQFANLTGFGAANSVTVTEGASAPFSLTAISCTSNGVQNNTVNIPARFVTIQLEPGENVVCTFVNAITTAAKVTVSGRITDEFGNGLPRTMVTIFNAGTAESRTVLSSSFGYYRFTDLEVGNIYVVSVQNKRYSFEMSALSFSLNDAIKNLDFIGAAQ